MFKFLTAERLARLPVSLPSRASCRVQWGNWGVALMWTTRPSGRSWPWWLHKTGLGCVLAVFWLRFGCVLVAFSCVSLAFILRVSGCFRLRWSCVSLAFLLLFSCFSMCLSCVCLACFVLLCVSCLFYLACLCFSLLVSCFYIVFICVCLAFDLIYLVCLLRFFARLLFFSCLSLVFFYLAYLLLFYDCDLFFSLLKTHVSCKYGNGQNQ